MSLHAPVADVQRVAGDQPGEVVLVADGIYCGDIVHIAIKRSTAVPGD